MNTPEIIHGEIMFTQDNHTESSATLGEFLKVKQHGLIDEKYWTINTQGEDWSFDTLEELTNTVLRAIRALTEGKEYKC